MKQYIQPSAAEVAKLETFVNQTLWGSVQNFDCEPAPLLTLCEV